MRLSRAESQAETRRRLLAAARAVVEREGLGAVTVSRVAEDAGLTTGAVYSNFAGRAELLFEVTRDLAQPLAATPPVDGGREAWLGGLAALLADHTDSPGAVSLATEMASIGLRDAKVRPAVVHVAQESLAEVEELLASCGPADDGFTDRELALVASALFAGLAQYRALLGSEEVPVELCARAFAALAGSEQARPRGRRARA